MNKWTERVKRPICGRICKGRLHKNGDGSAAFPSKHYFLHKRFYCKGNLLLVDLVREESESVK